jgi:hypothetical protein
MSDDEAVKAITAVFNRIQAIQLAISKLQYSSARWREVEALAIQWGFRECYAAEGGEQYVGMARMRISALQRNDCFAEARAIAMTNDRVALPPKYLDDDPMGDLAALQDWCIVSKRSIQQPQAVESPSYMEDSNIKREPNVLESQRIAYNQYRSALTDNPDSTIKEAYAAVQRASRIAGTDLPTFDTWSRYVRAAKSAVESKTEKPD